MKRPDLFTFAVRLQKCISVSESVSLDGSEYRPEFTRQQPLLPLARLQGGAYLLRSASGGSLNFGLRENGLS